MTFILGVAVSLLVQFLKKYSPNQFATLGLLLVVAIASADLYTALVVAGYWDTVAAILLTAGAFYAFILQRFEGSASA